MEASPKKGSTYIGYINLVATAWIGFQTVNSFVEAYQQFMGSKMLKLIGSLGIRNWCSL